MQERAKRPAVDVLRMLFSDRPDLLRVVISGDLASDQSLVELRRRDYLASTPIVQYVVGHTGAGKTSLANWLFGAEIMSHISNVDYIEGIWLLRMKRDLYYIDTPGAAADKRCENWVRIALGLPQVEEPVDSLEVYDATNTRMTASGKVEGAQRSRFTVEQWESQLSGVFEPDVVVYVVAPHFHFLRLDREFLTAMLKRHGAKVLITFNIWDGIPTDIHRDDVMKSIEAVYSTVFPDGSVRSRFTTVNARTGSGVDKLAREICQGIVPEKLGAMQHVLDGDLKKFAQRERSCRYHDTVNRIAARLALHTVGKKTCDQDLINAAAAGICLYGALTFEADATGITGVTERVVGTKAQQGGLPVIELLTAVGVGIEEYCTAIGKRASAETFIYQARDRVHLILDRERPGLEGLLQQGTAAEQAIAEVLDRSCSDEKFWDITSGGHVFISYISDDSKVVDRLQRDLENAGIAVWRDHSSLGPGDRWKKSIRQAIATGTFFLCCFSEASRRRVRSYMNEELALAIEELRARDQTWFLPVVFPGGKVPDWPIGAGETLRDLNYTSLSPETWHDGVNKLIWAIRQYQSVIRRKEESGNFDVFLCHNVTDKPTVRWVAERLRERGILPWLDEAELPPGRPWQEELERQIDSIQAAAVFVGPNGIGPWQSQEMMAFLREFAERRCPVIPVLLPGAVAPILPVFLRGMTWVDLRTQDPAAIERLIWGITGRKPGQPH
jgi:hypothetical protein